MSIFDVLSGGSLGSVLSSLTNQAKSAAANIKNNTPGGLPGLAGAGAIGALLGNVLGGDLMKNVALAGAGAVAWNFYKKWAANQQSAQTEEPAPAESVPAGWSNVLSPAPARGLDPTAELVLRAITYAARADGSIDATEQDRMEKVMDAMLPGQDVSGAMARLRDESIDPGRIAASVRSPEQAQDVYRLSCAVIDVDHFMETSYLEALAKSLSINAAQKSQLEAEAEQARRQLVAAANA